MEISGVVYRSIPRAVSGVAVGGAFPPNSLSMSSFSNAGSPCLPMNRGFKLRTPAESSEFLDNGHVLYYSGTTAVRCSAETKEKTMLKRKEIKGTKKRLKLLKSLSKDLSSFSAMGFGLNPENGLADQVKGDMISEATETLFKQLQKLKLEEKELKRKKKEEKAKMKATRMMNKPACEESSDGECAEVVNMSLLKVGTLGQQPSLKELLSAAIQLQTLPLSGTPTQEAAIIDRQPVTTQESIATIASAVKEQIERVADDHQSAEDLAQECCGSSSNVASRKSCCSQRSPDMVQTGKRIEVCMGGKCKKSGGALLLEEFQRMVDVEGVTGCKCLGKCRNGPNVRIVKNSSPADVDDCCRTPSNSLLLGVGMEDVGSIVTNFIGENQKKLNLAAAS